MGCIYDYKGRVFQTELELDDFLLERRHLVSKYGDIVFSKTLDDYLTKNQTLYIKGKEGLKWIF